MWKIYVGNLDARIRERELAEEFSVYGLVRSVWVARHPPGYAFIEFDTRREADDAVSALDGKHGWRVELSRRSSGGHKSKPYSSESRCRECGSSRHSTKDCRSQGARGSYRRSSSPRSRTILNRHSSPGRHGQSRSLRHGNSYKGRCDFPRKRERSISPETVCIKISQNDEGNSPTNESDAPRQDDPNTFSERSHSRSPNDQKGSADECIVPRKRERKRSPEHYPCKSPQNNQDSSHANENDAPRELEGTASPEHYPSSSQNDEDGSADECNVPRKRERKRSPEQYSSRSPQNDQDGSHADKNMEGKHECSRSPEHDLDLENYNDNSDVDANEKQDDNTSPEPEHNMSPQNNQDRSRADELSPSRGAF